MKTLHLEKIKLLPFLLLFFIINTYNVVGQRPPLWQDYLDGKANGTKHRLVDFSYAGYHFSEKTIPDVTSWKHFNVLDYGAIANDSNYDEAAIQATINAAQAYSGPAVVFFPPGKFIVSNNTDVTKFIKINRSNIVLKGSGSSTGGTEIFMDKKRAKNGHWQFVFNTGETIVNDEITTLTAEAFKGDFTVSVNSTVGLSVGQDIYLSHKSEEFARAHFGTLPLGNNWTRLLGPNGGMTLRENHIIKEIKGNKVTFVNPIATDLPMLTKPYSIRDAQLIEEIGVEDILFTSGWGNFPQEFRHHRNVTHDYGWNAIRFIHVKNSWLRNCEFRSWNQVMDIRESIGITVENVLISGKKGHASFITRRSYGLLIKDSEDRASSQHGPGVGYQGVATVYLRYKMSENQSIDAHSGQPYATLYDNIDGGHFKSNGGPKESWPHHGKDLVLWNFKHRMPSDFNYRLWSFRGTGDDGKISYVNPIFVGFQPNTSITFSDNARFNNATFELSDQEVEPKSLFEAQLAIRLNANNTSLSISDNNQIENVSSIYPNPFKDHFFIDNKKIDKINMFLITGKKIDISLEKITTNKYKIIPNENIAKGIYIIQIYNDNKKSYFKIIK